MTVTPVAERLAVELPLLLMTTKEFLAWVLILNLPYASPTL